VLTRLTAARVPPGAVRLRRAMARGAAAPAPAPAALPAKDYVPGDDAAALLLAHCVQKSAQVGGVLGCVVAAAASARARLAGAPLPPGRGTRLLAGGFALGTAALSVASAAKIASLDAEGVADRVYRLHYHAGQARTDRFANAAGFIGAALALSAFPGPSLPLAAVAGYAAGTAAGVAVHVASSLEHGGAA